VQCSWRILPQVSGRQGHLRASYMASFPATDLSQDWNCRVMPRSRRRRCATGLARYQSLKRKDDFPNDVALQHRASSRMACGSPNKVSLVVETFEGVSYAVRVPWRRVGSRPSDEVLTRWSALDDVALCERCTRVEWFADCSPPRQTFLFVIPTAVPGEMRYSNLSGWQEKEEPGARAPRRDQGGEARGPT
jgi:hypothetical protein